MGITLIPNMFTLTPENITLGIIAFVIIYLLVEAVKAWINTR